MRPTSKSPRRSVLQLLVATALAVSFVTAMPAPLSASHVLWKYGYPGRGSGGYDGIGDFNGDGLGDFFYWVYGDPFVPSALHLMLGAPYDQPFPEIVFPISFDGTVVGAGDLNADGFDDILFVAGYAQGLQVFCGSAVPELNADLAAPWSPPGYLTTVRALGDLNGDGFDDFALGVAVDNNGSPVRGRVSIFFGSAVLNGIPDLILDGSADGDMFGSAIAGGRDFNGDGFVDLAVGAPRADATSLTDAGEVRVYFGGPGLDAIPDRILQGSSAGAHLGMSLDLLADFDGDHYGDLVVATENPAAPHHRVSVFRGGPAFDGIPDWGVDDASIHLWPGTTPFADVQAGDDVNRDHYSDVLVSLTVIGIPESLAAGVRRGSHVYFGGSAPDTIPDTPLPYEIPWLLWAFTGAQAAGDVNGDGYQEWLVINDGFGSLGGAQLSLFTARTDYEVSPIGSMVGGGFTSAHWFGGGNAKILYAAGAAPWQQLASGVGGQLENSTGVAIPVGTTNNARIRVVSMTNDSSFAISAPFTVTAPTVGVGDTPARASLRITPSPAHRSSPVRVSIPELRRPDGQIATDLELLVFDMGGRQVDRIANHLEARSTVLQWTPAADGMRSGMYWLRARSASAAYSAAVRFIVVD